MNQDNHKKGKICTPPKGGNVLINRPLVLCAIASLGRPLEATGISSQSQLRAKKSLTLGQRMHQPGQSQRMCVIFHRR